MLFILAIVVFLGAAILCTAFLPLRAPSADTVAPRRGARSALVKKADLSPRFLLRLQAVLTRGGGRGGTGDLRRDLTLAGFEAPLAPLAFLAVRAGLTLGLPLWWLALQADGSGPSGLRGWLFPIMMAAFGFIVPWLLVTSRATRRREEIAREFPDALDLVVLCVDAGLELEAAFIRVGKAMEASHPAVGALIRRVGNDWDAGRGRSEALRAMADRAGIDAISAFVDLVIQAEALGAPIARLLRNQAHELREYRRLAAEEKAIRAPVLMTLPMVLLLLPVTFGALMLPAIIDLIRKFGEITQATGPGGP